MPGHVQAESGELAANTIAGTPLAKDRNSLQSLIAYALAHNPEVAATSFDGQAAAARTQAAQGALLPRITIEGGYTRYGDDLRLTAARYNGEPGVFGDNILAADLVLRLPLYTGGRLTAEMRAAELLEASAGQRLARSRGELVYNVSSLYYSQLAQVRLIESLNFSAETLTSQLERVNALIAGRKAAKVDALRTEVKLADIRQRLLREKNNLDVQRQALLNLMGAGADYVLTGTLNPPAAETRDLETLVGAALARRPDALAARADFQAQMARVEAARAGHQPTVNLVGSVGNRIMNQPTQHPAGLQTNDDVTRIGITFEMPLYEGGRTNARVDEENAKFGAQRERLVKLQLQIRLEVATAYTNMASALERLASTGKVIDLGTESLRIEQEKYALLRGTALDVLDAQSALLDAQTNHIRALADANAAAAQLALATGENLP
ncbi:outer membrane protein [Sulfurimicrobium lacus]|uniref:Outer membrane protein n=1 Tax=Sulfurimicrobium lacus TaxID=2715678 RepID=A0A6F8VF44_9PROT|nr:TolC family protein [Sulfurimicrobium lacus]BCB27339.1 outer membrane protein [Sulfurimicrobium lacus]